MDLISAWFEKPMRFPMKPTLALRSVLVGGLFFTATPVLHATPYYWDTDGATSGFGNTAGTQVLTGDLNNYSGNTTINGGTLDIYLSVSN